MIYKNKKISFFCISLKEHGERRKRFQRFADKHHWPVQYWEAFDGRGLKLDEFPVWVSKDIRPDHPAKLMPGEIGLTISTKKLFEHALKDQDLDYLVVLEDDAVISNSLEFNLRVDMDILFFNDRSDHNKKGELTGKSHGTDGYLISRCGMNKILALMTIENPVQLPIDLLIKSYCKSISNAGNKLSQYRNKNLQLLDCYHDKNLVKHDSYFKTSIQSSKIKKYFISVKKTISALKINN